MEKAEHDWLSRTKRHRPHTGKSEPDHDRRWNRESLLRRPEDAIKECLQFIGNHRTQWRVERAWDSCLLYNIQWWTMPLCSQLLGHRLNLTKQAWLSHHMAREIKLVHPDKFKDLVIWIATFHMMKLVLRCLGKCPKGGSGAQKIWTESIGRKGASPSK